MYLDALSGAVAEFVLLVITAFVVLDTHKHKKIAAAVVFTYVVLAALIYSLAAHSFGEAMNPVYWAFAK